MLLIMSTDPGELIILPAVILLCLGIAAAVWIGGNGGDITWISNVISSLIAPALILGVIIAGATALRD